MRTFTTREVHGRRSHEFEAAVAGDGAGRLAGISRAEQGIDAPSLDLVAVISCLLLAGRGVGCILGRGPERELALGHAVLRSERNRLVSRRVWPIGESCCGPFCGATMRGAGLRPRRPSSDYRMRCRFQARYEGLELGRRTVERNSRDGLDAPGFVRREFSSCGRFDPGTGRYEFCLICLDTGRAPSEG